MPGVIIQLDLADSVPRPVSPDGGVSLFGAWLRERIASIAIDWPGIAFHRIELGPTGVRLIILTGVGVPPVAAGFAVARAVRAEVQAAALACCGLRAGRSLWAGQMIVAMESVPSFAGAQDKRPTTPWDVVLRVSAASEAGPPEVVHGEYHGPILRDDLALDTLNTRPLEVPLRLLRRLAGRYR